MWRLSSLTQNGMYFRKKKRLCTFWLTQEEKHLFSEIHYDIKCQLAYSHYLQTLLFDILLMSCYHHLLLDPSLIIALPCQSLLVLNFAQIVGFVIKLLHEFVKFAKWNQNWSMTKISKLVELLLWTTGDEWVKVLNALASCALRNVDYKRERSKATL